MNNIMPYDDMSGMLQSEPSYLQEVDTIIRFFQASNMMREISLYRLYRIYVNREWTDTYDNSTDFVNSMANQMSVSARMLYDRIKTYDILAWLGIHSENAVRKMTENSTLYSKVFQAVIVGWDLETHSPEKIKIQGIDAESDEAKTAISGLLDTSEGFHNQATALEHIKADVLGTPIIKIYMKDYDDSIYVDYEFATIDESGNRIIDDFGFVRWLPEEDTDLPDEVIAGLRKRIEKR